MTASSDRRRLDRAGRGPPRAVAWLAAIALVVAAGLSRADDRPPAARPASPAAHTVVPEPRVIRLTEGKTAAAAPAVDATAYPRQDAAYPNPLYRDAAVRPAGFQQPGPPAPPPASGGHPPVEGALPGGWPGAGVSVVEGQLEGWPAGGYEDGLSRGQGGGPLFRLREWLGPHGEPPPPPCETWLCRPLSFDWFMGVVHGNELVDDWLAQRSGVFGGVRCGWDVDAYWGIKMRFALGETGLVDSARAIEAQQQADDHAGIDPSDPYRLRFAGRRAADFFYWDVDLVFYPLGDTRLRPYFLVGLGTVSVSFDDRLGNHYNDIVLGMPIAAGIKYRCIDWLGIFCEVTDNVGFSGGRGYNTLNDLSVVGGVEVRFGATRRNYWPWNPSVFYW